MIEGKATFRPEVLIDEQGLINQDLPCAQCGHNLRKLAPDTHCTECGADVQRAIALWKLAQCDPLWLTRIAAGFYWISIGILVPLVLFPLMFLSSRMLPPAMDLGAAALLATPFAVLFITLGLGVWRITSPTPNRSLTRLITFTRWCSRWLIVTAIALLFVGLNLFLVDAHSARNALIMGFLNGLLGIFMLACLLERLATQVKAIRLLWTTRILILYLLIFVLLSTANILLIEDWQSVQYIYDYIYRYIDPNVPPPPQWLVQYTNQAFPYTHWAGPTWSSIYEIWANELSNNLLTRAGIWPGMAGLAALALMMIWYRKRFLEAARMAHSPAERSDSSTDAQRACS